MNLEPDSSPRRIQSQDNKHSLLQGVTKAEKEEPVTLMGSLTPDQVNRNLPTEPILHSSSSVISSQVAETLRNPFQSKREAVSEERLAAREKRKTGQEKRKAEHHEEESDSKAERESHLRPKTQLKIEVRGLNRAGSIRFDEVPERDQVKLQAAATIARLPAMVEDEDHPDYDADYALVPIWEAALTHIDAQFISHQRQAILALEGTAQAPWGRNLLTNFYATLGREGKLTANIIATERAAIIASSRNLLSDCDKADIIEQLYVKDNFTSAEWVEEFAILAALGPEQISAKDLCETMRYLMNSKCPGQIENSVAEQVNALIQGLSKERFGEAAIASLTSHLDQVTRVEVLD